MKVHHLNCGTMRPRLVGGEMVCHCLLIETDQGLVLVDTGLGTHEVNAPRETLHGFFRTALRPALDATETAVHQVVGLGYHPSDVRHIVLTHLDLDHAGGLRDFPGATVHVLEDELTAARNPRTLNDRQRYPAPQFASITNWATYRAHGVPWFGFDAVRDLPGLPPEILLVPLIGHTRGHTGVAVHEDSGWLLHAGDAYFHRGELASPRSVPWLVRTFQRGVDTITELRVSNQDRLRSLVAEHADIDVFCAHDPAELTWRVSPGESRPSRA